MLGRPGILILIIMNLSGIFFLVTLILTCWQNLSSICSGRLDNADDVSEIMQRSPVGSRFAVSFCCFNKNENLYGGKEMLYTKV